MTESKRDFRKALASSMMKRSATTVVCSIKAPKRRPHNGFKASHGVILTQCCLKAVGATQDVTSEASTTIHEPAGKSAKLSGIRTGTTCWKIYQTTAAGTVHRDGASGSACNAHHTHKHLPLDPTSVGGVHLDDTINDNHLRITDTRTCLAANYKSQP